MILFGVKFKYQKHKTSPVILEIRKSYYGSGLIVEIFTHHFATYWNLKRWNMESLK